MQGPPRPEWAMRPFEGSNVWSRFGWIVTEGADGDVRLEAASEDDYRRSEGRNSGIPPERVELPYFSKMSASLWAPPPPNGVRIIILDRSRNYYYAIEI